MSMRAAAAANDAELDAEDELAVGAESVSALAASAADTPDADPSAKMPGNDASPLASADGVPA